VSIKAGQVIHSSDGYVINRIQSAGPGSINVPEEKIYEVGNVQSVGTVRDIPDLSFDLESLAVSSEFEALLTGIDPTTISAQQMFDLATARPLDILSPYKGSMSTFTIVKGIALPHLTLERATYRFGLRQNATQQFSLRGDSIYYIPGSPYHQVITNTGATTYLFGTTPTIAYVESGSTYYAYNITLKDSTDLTISKRLVLGADYTNTAAGFTLLTDWSATYDQIYVTYGSTTVATYPQSVHAGGTQPKAIRGKDIDIYVSDGAATPTLVRWTGVQSYEANWSVQLDNDEEFGNAHFVASDFDVPDVTGSIGVKPVDAADLWSKIANIAGVASTATAGALSSGPLEVEARISDPDTGSVVKTFYISDARFTVPAVSHRTQTKLETTFSFTSDGGNLKIYNGTKP